MPFAVNCDDFCVNDRATVRVAATVRLAFQPV
jgi:hypothetical protein